MAKIIGLVDDFEAGTRDAAKWTQYTDVNTSITRSSSQVHFGTTAVAVYAEYKSAVTWDLTESAVFAEVSAAPQVATVAGDLTVYLDGSNKAAVRQYGADLHFLSVTAGVLTTHATVTYSASSHRWWRLSHTGSTVSYETSADGTTWVQRATSTPSWALTSLSCIFSIYSDSTTAATFSVAGLNVLQVGKPVQALWHDRVVAGQSDQYLWNLGAVVGQNRSLLWSDRVAAGASEMLVWGTVGSTRLVSWIG